jgi:hypothetical protein
MPTFHKLPDRDQAPIDSEAFARWRALDGGVLVDFHRTAVGYIVRFRGRADFELSHDLNSVAAHPRPGTSERALSDLYLNQVLPMICGQQGDLVIHASAVASAEGALAFVAPTGRGKSTLAAAFSRSGVPFLSDDGITLVREGSGYTVRSNRPSFRLWKDSELALDLGGGPSDLSGEKARVAAAPTLPFQADSAPLKALYFLGDGMARQTMIQKLGVQAAMAELVNHSFLLDVTDRKRLGQHFQELGDVAQDVPCFTLDYPRDYTALPVVIAAILRHAGKKAELQ